MKLFLKFKHWQLFLIWILSGILFVATINTSIWILTFAIYDFIMVGWIYSIGKETNRLNGKNKIENYNEDLWFFLFLISLVPFAYFSHSLEKSNGFLIFGAILFESISAIKLVNFSAKALKQNEKKIDLKFTDYLTEFLLIIFFGIGIWIIQPRLNKIINKRS